MANYSKKQGNRKQYGARFTEKKQKPAIKFDKDVALLYGKNSVVERLRANFKSIHKIYLQDNFKEDSIVKLIKSVGVDFEYVSESYLARVKKADRLQGIVAVVDKFTYTDFEDLFSESSSVEKPTLLCLDGIYDPHNLGSIMRVAACYGKIAIIIPSNNSCEVNDTVMHVASGGENYVSVAKVNNLTNALLYAKEELYTVVGSIVEEADNINNVKFPFPLCLVVGSEGKGIRKGLRKHLDLAVRIPMNGANLSFNVTIACAIFCNEINRQQDF